MLVNGTRRHRSALVNLQLAPLGTVNQGAQAVDFSAIPSNAIERVEVLRDGAAVLYGSDAIAGVVNVILDESPERRQRLAAARRVPGRRRRPQQDRRRRRLPILRTVSCASAPSVDTSDMTSRGNPRPDAAAIAAIVGASTCAYNGFGQRWGDPEIDTNKLFVNAASRSPMTSSCTASAATPTTTRCPASSTARRCCRRSTSITGRNTLIVDANGDFLPDNAPQSLVNSILAAGPAIPPTTSPPAPAARAAGCC